MFAHVHLFSMFLSIAECIQRMHKHAHMCSLCCMGLNMCVHMHVHIQVQEHERRGWTHSCSVSSNLLRPNSVSFPSKFLCISPFLHGKTLLSSCFCSWNCTHCPKVGPQVFSGCLRLTTSCSRRGEVAPCLCQAGGLCWGQRPEGPKTACTLRQVEQLRVVQVHWPGFAEGEVHFSNT